MSTTIIFQYLNKEMIVYKFKINKAKNNHKDKDWIANNKHKNIILVMVKASTYHLLQHSRKI